MSSETPPNPFYKRLYRATTDAGCAEVSISAPNNKLPVGEDADELIAFFQLIIRQIERSRDKAETDAYDKQYPAKGAEQT